MQSRSPLAAAASERTHSACTAESAAHASRPAQDDEPCVGLDTLLLAGNDLREAGALALANHLMTDCWLCKLDLRRNGISEAGQVALIAAAEERDTAESEKLLDVPPLVVHLHGPSLGIGAVHPPLYSARGLHLWSPRSHDAMCKFYTCRRQS